MKTDEHRITKREQKVLVAWYGDGARYVETLAKLSGESKTFVTRTLKRLKLKPSR